MKYPPIPGEAQTPDDNFIDAILGRAEPQTSPLNGINQSELMDAIYRVGADRPDRPPQVALTFQIRTGQVPGRPSATLLSAGRGEGWPDAWARHRRTAYPGSNLTSHPATGREPRWSPPGSAPFSVAASRPFWARRGLQ